MSLDYFMQATGLQGIGSGVSAGNGLAVDAINLGEAAQVRCIWGGPKIS